VHYGAWNDIKMAKKHGELRSIPVGILRFLWNVHRIVIMVCGQREVGGAGVPPPHHDMRVGTTPLPRCWAGGGVRTAQFGGNRATLRRECSSEPDSAP
jgi:hypothetical protein